MGLSPWLLTLLSQPLDSYHRLISRLVREDLETTITFDHHNSY